MGRQWAPRNDQDRRRAARADRRQLSFKLNRLRNGAVVNSDLGLTRDEAPGTPLESAIKTNNLYL
jgi:hypothetical protein